MRRIIVGVMGPGLEPHASDTTEQAPSEPLTGDYLPERILNTAHLLGRSIAMKGWVLLTGGRMVGVLMINIPGGSV